MRRLPLAALVFVAAGCQSGPDPEACPAADAVLQAVHDRLALMPAVARQKCYLGRPVDDPERQEAFLTLVAADADAAGLDPDYACRVFVGQLAAAKAWQAREIATLPRPDPCPEGIAAATERLACLRTRICERNRDLLAALGRLAPHRSSPEVRDYLRARADEVLADIPADIREIALAPLFECG